MLSKQKGGVGGGGCSSTRWIACIALLSTCWRALLERAVEESRSRSVILYYGGSFSPIQLNHVEAAKAGKKAVEDSAYNLTLHSVRVSPVADAYGKKGLWPASDRLLLALLAFQEDREEGIIVDPWESEQDKYLKTYETLQHLSSQYKAPNGEADALMLLGGSDQFEAMLLDTPTSSVPWTWPAEELDLLVNELDGFVINVRAEHHDWSVDTIRDQLQKKLGGRNSASRLASDEFIIIVNSQQKVVLSSTMVRDQIAGSLDTTDKKNQLAEWVGQAVTNQIVSREEYFQDLVKKASGEHAGALPPPAEKTGVNALQQPPAEKTGENALQQPALDVDVNVHVDVHAVGSS